MRQFLSIVLLAAAIYGAYRFSQYWKEFKAKQEMTNHDREEAAVQATNQAAPAKLPGMNPTYEASLETSLATAKHSGPAALKKWLDQYRQYVQDPRLGDLELDYCLMIDRTDLPEAKRVFAEVKKRTPPNSPLAERVKRLARSYE